MKFNFDKIQSLGRALMLPVALLPVAGILLRFGQPDLLNIKFIADSGNIIFTNLAILFAVGIAIGLAKENNGTAALAALVGFFIMDTILKDINKEINTGVLGGILVGIIAAIIYNRYKDIKLPPYLAFFGGKQFVPIATGLSCVILGVILGYIWPPIQNSINTFGNWLIMDAGAFGVFIYGVLNRILIITGLHHILNNLTWFVFGDYTNSTEVVVHGDIARFMTGDKTAGTFMAGYFPIMMFGLPAACIAMYKNALPENKKAVAGMLLSMALTSFLTGVTEPIEFSFVFLAPVLFVLHAVLTGLSMAIMYMLNVHLGFTFSAGLIDYVLFYKLSTNPLYLIPIGVAFFIVYYFTFDYFIRRYNLPTIGRDLTSAGEVSTAQTDSQALQFINALGGQDNIIAVDSCMTRLRLTMRDSANIDKNLLKALGSHGEIAPTHETLQVIVGTTADLIASNIREALLSNNAIHNIQTPKPVRNQQHAQVLAQDIVIDDLSNTIAQNILVYLGGKDNIQSLDLVALSRLRIEIKNDKNITLDMIKNLTIIEVSDKIKQFYIGDNAQTVYWALEQA